MATSAASLASIEDGGEHAEVRRRLVGQELRVESAPVLLQRAVEHQHLPPGVDEGGAGLVWGDVGQLVQSVSLDDVASQRVESCRLGVQAVRTVRLMAVP